LNLPGADQPGSVGRPLAGRVLRVLADGRIQVRDPGFLGYAGEPPYGEGWFETGDLGAIDRHGFVRIEGRRKNLLITAYGRNVAPEWVESELLAEPGIEQSVVCGDGEPALGALIVSADGVDPAGAIVPLTGASGLVTPNGRIRRELVLERFRQTIAVMFNRHEREAALPL
jgi:long-subunit acyl-CoA synthetase (AMP-forming)